MERAWQQLRGQGVEFVAINVDEDAKTVAEFAEAVDVSFPLLLDPGGKVTQAWPLRGLPTTFVVDPEGKLFFRALGERDWDSVPILNEIRMLSGAAVTPHAATEEESADETPEQTANPIAPGEANERAPSAASPAAGISARQEAESRTELPSRTLKP